ncbi:hypothetical protein LTR70_007873 [Exophiala xenobiotica]|uniref:Sfi1 spindle body domain-containing protein n=1 Tax=Lithohypha guttulata TaxID=1690604 RepID=A0ABR0K306_9EURO|nr:hypothetical protein LTR24_007545 [Lithohypha guttulata]KAK5312956.1 hypothetical protein LTR70_007873 [Exophiala xenobiotica]
MSEGRTPTATITQQRRLEQDDIDILHQIVIRAQNDQISQERPKDALLHAYGEIFDERRLSQHQDRACFNVLLKLLNPATPGESLYHKFEHILQEEGIVLAFDDDATTQHGAIDPLGRHSDGVSEHAGRPLSRTSQYVEKLNRRSASADDSQLMTRNGYYPTEAGFGDRTVEAPYEDDYLDDPPPNMAQIWRQAEMRDRIVLVRQTLDVWRDAWDAVRQRQLEARADALYELRLKRKVLKQSLAVFQDLRNSQIRADQIYYRRLARNALGQTSDEYRVRRVTSMDEDRLKGTSLYKWTVASREASFVRTKDFNLKQVIMHKLIGSFRASQAQQARLEDMLRRRNVQNQGALLRSAMSLLVQNQNVVQEREVRADYHNQSALYHASINAWRSKMGKLNDLNLTAADAREYFLMKRVLTRLRSLTRFRKERREWLAIWTARKWQDFVKTRKHARYDEAYRHMRRTIKVNAARKFLLRWQQKVHNRREDNARADALYQTSILQRIVRPVVETTYDTAEWVKNNESVADQRAEQFLQQRAIIAIQMKQQSLFDMTDRADRLRQYRTEQRAVQGLRQMQLKAFELQRRTSDADAFRDRRNKRAVRNILARLRRVLAERRSGHEGALALVPPPAVTPARKKEALLLNSSMRLSTTPAYTPFSVRLRQEPRVLADITDDDEEDMEDMQHDFGDADVEA